MLEVRLLRPSAPKPYCFLSRLFWGTTKWYESILGCSYLLGVRQSSSSLLLFLGDSRHVSQDRKIKCICAIVHADHYLGLFQHSFFSVSNSDVSLKTNTGMCFPRHLMQVSTSLNCRPFLLPNIRWLINQNSYHFLYFNDQYFQSINWRS